MGTRDDLTLVSASAEVFAEDCTSRDGSCTNLELLTSLSRATRSAIRALERRVFRFGDAEWFLDALLREVEVFVGSDFVTTS